MEKWPQDMMFHEAFFYLTWKFGSPPGNLTWKLVEKKHLTWKVLGIYSGTKKSSRRVTPRKVVMEKWPQEIEGKVTPESYTQKGGHGEVAP